MQFTNHQKFAVVRINDDGSASVLHHSDDIDACHSYKQFHHPNQLNTAVYKRDIFETFELT